MFLKYQGFKCEKTDQQNKGKLITSREEPQKQLGDMEAKPKDWSLLVVWSSWAAKPKWRILASQTLFAIIAKLLFTTQTNWWRILQQTQIKPANKTLSLLSPSLPLITQSCLLFKSFEIFRKGEQGKDQLTRRHGKHCWFLFFLCSVEKPRRR